MTAKRRRKADKGKRGPRGPRGQRGVRGPAGPGAPSTEAFNRLAADLIDAQDSLQVQFKRIAQLQAELDELRSQLRKGQ